MIDLEAIKVRCESGYYDEEDPLTRSVLDGDNLIAEVERLQEVLSTIALCGCDNGCEYECISEFEDPENYCPACYAKAVLENK